jgi:polysaccharide export outer membrane protein
MIHDSLTSMRNLILLTIVSLIQIGCLRYTPSHRELKEMNSGEQPSDTNSKIDPIGGLDDFENYERSLTQRVQSLLTERTHLLDPSNSKSGYPIGTGDMLDVSVFGFNNLTANTAVTSDGSIILPLVGRVEVAGLPIEDVQTTLSRRYSQYIRSPQVLVALKTFSTNRVSVIGEVNKPGTYPLIRRGIVLTEILSEAGGRTPAAGTRIVLLPAPRIRTTQASNITTPTLSLVQNTAPEPTSGIEVDMEDLMGTVDKRPLIIPLVPGDTIIVPEAGSYEVDGEVTTPGSFKLTGRTSVIGAIAAAKGFTYSADVNNVEVIRDLGAGRKALISLDLEEVGLRGSRDIRLRNGDLVRVPSHSGRFFKRQIVETINGLFNGVGVNKRMN